MQYFLVLSVGLSLCYGLTLLVAPIAVEGAFSGKKLLVGLATAGTSIAVFFTMISGR